MHTATPIGSGSGNSISGAQPSLAPNPYQDTAPKAEKILDIHQINTFSPTSRRTLFAVNTPANQRTNGSAQRKLEKEKPAKTSRLQKAVIIVAVLNLAYFFIEGIVALSIGSVSLLADSVDFFEDFAVNMLIAIALGWSLKWRARAGKASAALILLPAVAAVWQIVSKFPNPDAPPWGMLLITAGGAIVVNFICAMILSRFRDGSGALTKAAFLAARNDVYVNIAIILMAGITALTHSGWPDIILGAFILILNGTAAKEVYETAHSETLAARAEAGEVGCTCGHKD